MSTRHISRDQLPAVGEWDGPLHGQLGVLLEEDGKLQCHACGRWYEFLAIHAYMTHHLLADEYRAIFGLRARTSLAGAGLREKKRILATPILRPFAASSPLKTMTAEERSGYLRGRKWALEAKRDPVNQTTWKTAPWHQKSGQRMRELVSDPEYRARFSRKVSQAKGGRVQVACAMCGTLIAVKRYLAAEGRSRVCSKQCFRELRRRQALESTPWHREEVRAKLSQQNRGKRGNDYEGTLAKLRAVPEERFAVLSERNRQIVQGYYGLLGGQPLTYRELKARFQLSAAGIHHVLRQGVTMLLTAVANEDSLSAGMGAVDS